MDFHSCKYFWSYYRSVNFIMFFRSLKFSKKPTKNLTNFCPGILKVVKSSYMLFNAECYKKIPLICWFDQFVDSGAEFCQIFCWFFGKFNILKRHSEINWPLDWWISGHFDKLARLYLPFVLILNFGYNFFLNFAPARAIERHAKGQIIL